MHLRRIPEWVRHAPTPGVRGFAVLSALDALARGILLSVYPLVMYRALGDASLVSVVYFGVGVTSLFVGLMTPTLTRYFTRRWMFTVGVGLYLSGALLAATGEPHLVVFALLLHTCAVVVVFICHNAYVLDYVAQAELGRNETLRMFYSALSWAVGPVAGVWLMKLWSPAPFLVSAAASFSLLVVFWWMRLGNGKLIRRARAPAPNPLRYIGRFLEQPRLVAGWLFAVLRSCGWWVYVVYVPIFAVKNGLGETLGGLALSLTNSLLFITPLMLRWMQRRSVRRAVRTGFAGSAVFFFIAPFLAGQPELTILSLMAGSFFMILLDISGGLPFLLAVKPSERTEMSAIYSSFRDVSSILTPGAAWLVLLVAPLPVIFAVAAGGLVTAFAIASRLHPRLGRKPVVAE